MWREGGERTNATSFWEREGRRDLREDEREATWLRKVEKVRRWVVAAWMMKGVVERAA